MLTEEALLLALTLSACVLVILGTLELIAPSRPFRLGGLEGPPKPPALGAAPAQLGRPSTTVPNPPALGTAPAKFGPPSSTAPKPAALGGASAQLGRASTTAPKPPAFGDGPAKVPRRSTVGDERPVTESTLPAVGNGRAKARPELMVAERCPAVVRCVQLLERGHHAEVVAEATAALAPSRFPTAAVSRDEAAVLWSLIGQSHHAVGDDEAARAALESAVAVASAAHRTEHESQLVALTLRVAQGRLDRAVEDGPHEPEDRVTGILDAIAWLDRGIALRRADSALVEVRHAARTALGPAYEDAARSLARRHEYFRARCLLGNALADADLAASRGPMLRGLLSATFNSEIGHLSAQACLSLRESRETEALASLRRAEDLIGAMPVDALSTTRREEVDRRLRWGYTRLAQRRLEDGEVETAVELLLRALRFNTGRDGAAETRGVLVEALETVVGIRARAIREVAATGDRDAALLQSEELWALLTRVRDAGLAHDDLTGALTQTRELCQSLDART